MPVDTEVAYAERAWTGIETDLSPGFVAQDVDHVQVSYLDALETLTALTADVHYTISKDGDPGQAGAISVLPRAMPTAPGTVIFERVTPATQDTDFANLQDFDPDVHTKLADAAALRAAELRGKQNRAVVPYTVFNEYVDFGGRRVLGADPVNDGDFATKGYVLQITGVLALQGYVDQAQTAAANADAAKDGAITAETGAEAARDKGQLWAEQAEDTEVEPGKYSALHHAAKAAASSAQILPYLTTSDDGLFGDVDTGNIDDGVFP